MPPDIPFAEDGHERAGREQGIYAKHALRKYVADRRLTQVVTPDCRRYTLNHGKVLVERISAVIEQLEFPREKKTICVSIS